MNYNSAPNNETLFVLINRNKYSQTDILHDQLYSYLIRLLSLNALSFYALAHGMVHCQYFSVKINKYGRNIG